jgi:hypothetical protein
MTLIREGVSNENTRLSDIVHPKTGGNHGHRPGREAEPIAFLTVGKTTGRPLVTTGWTGARLGPCTFLLLSFGQRRLYPTTPPPGALRRTSFPGPW